jgi:hypothetical protein
LKEHFGESSNLGGGTQYVFSKICKIGLPPLAGGRYRCPEEQFDQQKVGGWNVSEEI